MRIIVTGIGTDVGKTVCSAIIAEALGADYWKPIQSGCEEGTDTERIASLIDNHYSQYHLEAYKLPYPLSPHHSARLAGINIRPEHIIPPETDRPLVIEGTGGLLVPLTTQYTLADLFLQWNGLWIVVSKHYLGSINHTLLTLDYLKSRGTHATGIIFNGLPNPDSEKVILEYGKTPMIGRLLPEKVIDKETIKKYGDLWKPALLPLLQPETTQLSGTPSHK